VPVVPFYCYAGPINCANCALISEAVFPANAVAKPEKPRFVAGHFFKRMLFMMLTQVSVKRLRAGICQQRFEHRVASAAFGEMFAVGFA
jgi:hypothetical protein